jgi:hypothetical protein
MSISTPIASSLPTIDATLPHGYVETLYWRLASDWRRLAGANLMGLFAAPVAAVLFGALGTALGGFNMAELLALRDSQSPDGRIAIALIAVILGTMIMHELTHGAAIRWCGNHPSYGFQWLGLVPYATARGQHFTRNQFIVCALAPVVGLSAVGTLLLPLSPSWLVPWLLVGLIVNATGATGDMWMSAIALRYPSSARITDEQDGIRVFVRDEA